MSKPEDPDNWRYKPNARFVNSSYQSLTSSIMPQKLMKDISMQNASELKTRFQYLRGQIQSLQKLYYHYSMQV
jgi:hypothetical protein